MTSSIEDDEPSAAVYYSYQKLSLRCSILLKTMGKKYKSMESLRLALEQSAVVANNDDANMLECSEELEKSPVSNTAGEENSVTAAYQKLNENCSKLLLAVKKRHTQFEELNEFLSKFNKEGSKANANYYSDHMATNDKEAEQAADEYPPCLLVFEVYKEKCTKILRAMTRKHCAMKQINNLVDHVISQLYRVDDKDGNGDENEEARMTQCIKNIAENSYTQKRLSIDRSLAAAEEEKKDDAETMVQHEHSRAGLYLKDGPSKLRRYYNSTEHQSNTQVLKVKSQAQEEQIQALEKRHTEHCAQTDLELTTLKNAVMAQQTDIRVFGDIVELYQSSHQTTRKEILTLKDVTRSTPENSHLPRRDPVTMKAEMYDTRGGADDAKTRRRISAVKTALKQIQSDSHETKHSNYQLRQDLRDFRRYVHK